MALRIVAYALAALLVLWLVSGVILTAWSIATAPRLDELVEDQEE